MNCCPAQPPVQRCLQSVGFITSRRYLSLHSTFLLCFTVQLPPLFHGSTSVGALGVWCSSGALQTKLKWLWVKLLWPYLFISSRLSLKHWLWPFRNSVLFSLTNCKAWHWKVKIPAAVLLGLRRDRRGCQRVTWNTWVGRAAGQTWGCVHVLVEYESAICCFDFSLWIRANYKNRDDWTPGGFTSLNG